MMITPAAPVIGSPDGNLLVPVWRSLLFVPANRADRVGKAAASGADAVILDLEDAVAAEAKPAARTALPELAAQIRAHGVVPLVRINSPWRAALADLDAVREAGIDTIIVPKLDSASQLKVLTDMAGPPRNESGSAAAAIRMIGLVESPRTLRRLDEIVAVENLIGLALGTEDFCLRLGVAPTPRSLDLPCRQIALAAAERGLLALGLPLSIAEFRDLAAYRAAALDGRAFGMTGALCIHPAQVSVINACWRPSDADHEEALGILAAWELAQAAGEGVTAYAGRMVDLPVVLRARRTAALSLQSVGLQNVGLQSVGPQGVRP